MALSSIFVGHLLLDWFDRVSFFSLCPMYPSVRFTAQSKEGERESVRERQREQTNGSKRSRTDSVHEAARRERGTAGAHGHWHCPPATVRHRGTLACAAPMHRTPGAATCIVGRRPRPGPDRSSEPRRSHEREEEKRTTYRLTAPPS